MNIRASILVILLAVLMVIPIGSVVYASPGTERLAPDAILELTNLTGTVSEIQDDPDSPDTDWLDAISNNQDSVCRVSFPTPTGNPTIGAGLQEFRVLVRKYGGTGTPEARIELYEDGGLIRAGPENDVTGDLVISFTWNANEISTADGSLVECRLYGTKSGGGPSARATIEVGAIEWNVEYDEVGPPAVTTQAATNVEETTATGHGNITSTGGESCDERGFDYDIDSGEPYTYEETETGSFGTGAYSLGLTGLSPGTTYYYRAKAHNSYGWGYGNEVLFYTKPEGPTGLTDTGRTNTSVSLSWTKGIGSEKTMVRYRTDQYPVDETDGTEAYFDTGESTTVSPLSSGQIYYFRAWAWDENSGYSDNTSDDTAYTNPGDPSNLTATAVSETQIDLTWSKGVGGDKTMIRRKTGSYPVDETDGEEAYFDTGTAHNDIGRSPGTEYFYRAWAYDSDSGYYSDNYTQDSAKTFEPPPPPPPITWESYRGAGHETMWGTEDNPYAGWSSTTTAYMYGENLEAEQLYHVGFYDASLAGDRVASTDPTSDVFGRLSTQYILFADPDAQEGMWHAVVYEDPDTPPDTYTADDPNAVVDDDFKVLASAISSLGAWVYDTNSGMVLLGLSIVGLALWQKALPLYILAGIGVFFIGSQWFDIGWQVGMGGMFLACYLLYRAVRQTVVGEIGY